MKQDDIREHSDYSVIASNFIDRRSSIMVSRVPTFLDGQRLLGSNLARRSTDAQDHDDPHQQRRME